MPCPGNKTASASHALFLLDTSLSEHPDPNPNLLGGETHVQVKGTRFAGKPQETTERHTVVLEKHNEEVEVCSVPF